MPLFYAPVAVWVLWLAARHRGMSTITAANPGIVDGGTVGESKGAILARLPPEYTIPFALLPGGESADVRARGALEIVGRRGWSLPLIMKPDVGQRGAGVRLVRSAEEVSSYLRREPRAVLLQPYHEGPFEAGVFYYRFPHQKRGRIFSITDKIFPVIVGDGRSTVGELIWAHPRYRLQADLFCRRHTDVIGRTLSRGERLTLAVAGNHAQGALFLNGAHLNTTALEERIDDIARSFPGFFIGRFDIRYRSVEDFKAGRDLAIVELNGSMAESTAIYDPDTSLLDAYRELFAQWRLVFAIGSANRALGAPVSSTRRLITLFAAHVSAPAPAISD